MLTIRQIENAAKYLGRHLSANDYYAEGERVTGYWLGKGADMLGLEGDATSEQFELIRQSRHPQTGEKLRPRQSKVEFHDIVLSAPKSFSIAAVVGGDERLEEAFRQSTVATFTELERFAEVRDRSGKNYHSEKTIRTGNTVAAVYQHDSSRLLDPQCHSHMVHGNLSFCAERSGWFALQPEAMMKATEIVQFFRKDLAARVEALGYEVKWRANGNFGIKGISKALEEKFSTRTIQRKAFEKRFQDLFGHAPSKDRIAQFIRENKAQAINRFSSEYQAHFGKAPSKETVSNFVKDWRSSKLIRISTKEVRRRQRAKLTQFEASQLDALITRAIERVIAQEARYEANTKDTDPQTADEKLRRFIPLQDMIVSSGKQAFVSLSELASASQQKAREYINDSIAQKEAREKKAKQLANHQRRVRISRTEILRRMRFGMTVQQAVRGYPAKAIRASSWKIRR